MRIDAALFRRQLHGLKSNWFRPAVVWLLFLILLFVYRVQVARDLGIMDLSSASLIATALFLGALSDLWAASLLVTLLLWLPRLAPWLFAVLAVFLAGLVPYVEFFGVNLRYIHLPYLVDIDFVTASKGDLLRASSLIFLFIGAFCVVVLWLVDRKASRCRNTPAQVIMSVVVLLTGLIANYVCNSEARGRDLAAHYVNNWIIDLVLDAQATRQKEERQKVRPNDIKRVRAKSDAYDVSLALRQPAVSGPRGRTPWQDSVLESLRNEFSAEKLKQARRYFIVLLLEGGRAYESALLEPETGGFAPNMDSLMQGGITFGQAIASGTVTRSAQESVACDAFASLNSNAMRDMPLINPLCAHDIFAPWLKEKGVASDYLWLHGGAHSFDTQGKFWRRENFSVPIDVATVGPDIPKGAWGINDRAFLRMAAEELARREGSAGLTLSLVLTVSNHTGWTLPSDAPRELVEKSGGFPHPYFGSYSYMDWALGRFVDDLKRQGVWDKAVLLFLGDHGLNQRFATEPHWNLDPSLVSARKLSRIVMGMNGGLVEKALERCRQDGRCGATIRDDSPVSQADVMPTLADLLGDTTLRFYGESLFASARRWPVFSDLGNRILVPGLSPEVLPIDVALGDEKKLSEGWRQFASYYRVYLNFRNAPTQR